MSSALKSTAFIAAALHALLKPPATSAALGEPCFNFPRTSYLAVLKNPVLYGPTLTSIEPAPSLHLSSPNHIHRWSSVRPKHSPGPRLRHQTP
ncbi:hypothetical protein PtA15_3A749 [Puccinia triticina]|uniref:Secreted protein n=1 Tax=Puccinia triticina TaxID=208348 RepID=A0ABY7CFA7_9BASI|nr:uncharacterized protein PtA15_3A749 [Puccinia triticina]WAQ83379.1 hypothetical protein PtA15_3A749 [Puccinia triticina]